MKDCDACGKPVNGGVGIGGALLCRTCAEDVQSEIYTLRDQGKQVSAVGIARRIFRKTHSAGNYLLRDIPEDIWNQAKHKAVDEGSSLRELILKALRAYL
jgi:hypothetical protein